MEIIEKIFKFLGFIVLTALVVPAMLVMVWLHPTWSKWMEELAK